MTTLYAIIDVITLVPGMKNKEREKERKRKKETGEGIDKRNKLYIFCRARRKRKLPPLIVDVITTHYCIATNTLERVCIQ